MTTYYFVGSGNWSDSARWSLSSGGTGGAGVPGSSDTARFDANSGNVTLTGDTTVGILDATGWVTSYGSKIFTFGNYSLTITGSGNALVMPGTASINAIGWEGTPPSIYLTNATSNATTVTWFAMNYYGTVFANFYCSSGNFALTVGGYFNDFDLYANGTSTYSGQLTLQDMQCAGTFALNTTASGMTLSGNAGYSLFMAGANSYVRTNGQTLTSNLYIYPYSSIRNVTCTLLDALTFDNYSQIYVDSSATLKMNGKNVTCPRGVLCIGKLDFGAGIPTLTVGDYFNYGFTSAFFTGQGTATIATVNTWGTVLISGRTDTTVPATLNMTSTGGILVSKGNFLNIRNTVYDTVQFSGPLRFVDFSLKGAAGTPVIVQGIASNTSVTKVDPWYVGPNSTDAGGNTGILFSGNEGSDYLTVSNLSGTYNYGPHFMAFM